MQTNAYYDDWGNPIADGSPTIEARDSEDGAVFRARVEYAAPEPGESQEFSWEPRIGDWEASPNVVKRVRSLATTSYGLNGNVAPNFYGGIGWNGDGFDGVDVDEISVDFTIVAKSPENAFDDFANFLNVNILPYFGKCNSTSFYGFNAGNCRFRGVSSGDLKNYSGGADYEPFNYWELTYNFSALPSASTTIAGTTIAKAGWDYVWTLDERSLDASSGRIVAIPVAAYVERVFERIDLNGLF